MNPTCLPDAPTHTTRRCVFKLYAGSVRGATARGLDGLASTWIAAETAVSVLSRCDGASLPVFWWEGGTLCRTVLDAGGRLARHTRDPVAVATCDDIALIAFEAVAWSRHVLCREPPSIPAYLAEVFA